MEERATTRQCGRGWKSKDVPLRPLGPGVQFPHPNAASKDITIVSRLDTSRQLVELLRVSAAKNNVIRDEGQLELLHAEQDFALPLLFSEPLQTGFAENLLDDAALIGKVAEFERKHIAGPKQG